MRVKIPITPNLYTNIEETSLDRVSAEAINLWVNDADCPIKRPGLQLKWDLGTNYSISGIYWWEAKNILIFAAGENLWKVLALDDIPSLIPGAKLKGGRKPTFCDNGNYLIIADGGQMLLWDGVSSIKYIPSADAPQYVSHVCLMNQHVIANQLNSGKFYFSGYNTTTGEFDPATWNALDFATAENKPDKITGLFQAWQELLLVGTSTIEFWRYDGETPFSPLTGLVLNHGTIAPYTFKFLENSWIWIDEQRYIRQLAGRETKIISTPIDNLIRKNTNISNSTAEVILVNGKLLYLLNLGGEDFTLIYDSTKDRWFKWAIWDTNNGVYKKWYINSAVYVPIWNKTLIGSCYDSKIYSIDSSYLDDAENKIRVLYRTGHLSHNTTSRKRSNKLLLKLHRGRVNKQEDAQNPLDTNDETTLMIRWRDNGSSKWSEEIHVSLGRQGETEFIQQLNRLGIYRTRQYEFSLSDRVPFVLADIEEEVDIL